jgi:hypothetical protein
LRAVLNLLVADDFPSTPDVVCKASPEPQAAFDGSSRLPTLTLNTLGSKGLVGSEPLLFPPEVIRHTFLALCMQDRD